MAIYTADRLRHVATTLFVGAGASEHEAKTIAHYSVAANLAGHDSHGVIMLPSYLDRIEKKHISPGAPSFAEGDVVVLVLTASGPSMPVVTGTTQGVYRVARDLRTLRLVVVPPLIDAGPTRLVRGDLERRPLSVEAFGAAVAVARGNR